MVRRSLCAVALLAGIAAGGPALTTIQDVLYKADGTPFTGVIFISWSSFQTADNSAIVTQTSTVNVVDGNLRVQLAPSTTGTPAVIYSVTYNSNGLVQFQESWSVPPSATPLRVKDVRVASSGSSTSGGGSGSGGSDSTGGNSGGLTTNIPETQVTGLSADLAARAIKGPAFAAGRSAIVDAAGLLESATGNAGDCMHVDGSSGACGGNAPSFVDSDSPAGIVDGSNVTFALTAVPSPATSLAVYRNGLLQKPGFDYTAAGNSLQFAVLSAPQPGDTLVASYRTAAGNGAVASSFAGYSTTQVLCSGVGATSSSFIAGESGHVYDSGGFAGAGRPHRDSLRFRAWRRLGGILN